VIRGLGAKDEICAGPGNDDWLLGELLISCES
jgi:hypothetical protein